MPQLAGEDILASDIKMPRYIIKAASEGVTNSAVLQNDDDFAIPLEAGKTYEIRLYLHASQSTIGTGDIQTAWATTGTITGLGRSVMGPAAAVTNAQDTTMGYSGHGLTTAVARGVDDTVSTVIVEQLIVQCTVAGTITFQWSQNVAVAGVTTTLSTASRCIITEIEEF